MFASVSRQEQQKRRTRPIDTRTRYRLEIISDAICPWCYIGKRRLDAALSEIGEGIPLDVCWRPFELNPDMPREGMDRRAYRSAKFGSWEESLRLDAQVKAAGAQSNLDFHHDRIEKTPNTLSSHVLLRLARDFDRQAEVAEAIFAAYFTEGRDVGDPTVLTDLAVGCGLTRSTVGVALADDQLRRSVKAEARAFREGGVSGVPTVMLNRFVLFTGAQEPSFVVQALRQAAEHESVIEAGRRLGDG